MSDLIRHLEHDWHSGEQHVSGWFHRATRHSAAVTSDGDSIQVSETQAPPALGDIVSLAALVDEMKTGLEEGLVKLHTVLDEKIPQAIELGQTIESNPIIDSVLGALHVPDEILAPVAALLDKLAAAYPKPAAAPAPVEAEPAPEPAAA